MMHETRPEKVKHEGFDYGGCIPTFVQEKRDETRVFQGPAQKAGRRELPKAW